MMAVTVLHLNSKMASSRKIDVSFKFLSLTECLLHLVSSTYNDDRASGIKLKIDFDSGHFYYVCEGMALDKSEMNLIHNIRSEINNLMDVRDDSLVLTLSRIVAHSKKIEIVATKRKRRFAYEMVFEDGIKTEMRLIPAKHRVSTIINVTGLSDIPTRSGDMGCYEYFILKYQLRALALNHCKIPIQVTESIYGEILKWPGKFTGLGSAFAALVQSDANTILSAHAKFHDVRMKAFVSLNLHYSKSHQYVYINNQFVRWEYLYTFFNRILSKTFGMNIGESKDHFQFVLNIECPEEYCHIHYSFFTPEIRVRYLSPVASCFSLLSSNIEMMFTFKKLSQFGRQKILVSKDHNMEEHFDNLILILDYSWEFDFGTLIEPLLMKRRQELNALKQGDCLYKILSIAKMRFGSYRVTLYETNILPPVLLHFIHFFLNAWIDNPARRNGYFNLLKEALSYVSDIPTSESKKDFLKLDVISKPNIKMDKKTEKSNVQYISNSYDTRYMLKPCSSCEKDLALTEANVHTLDSESAGWSLAKQSTTRNSPQNFSTAGRNSYAPKGTSPMATKIENIAVCCGSTAEDFTNTTVIDVIKKNPTVDKNIGLLRKLKIHNDEGDIRMISKDLFNHMNVIGQLDTKFIICELKRTEKPNETGFIIFDQHGIDERIRLEELSNHPFDDFPKHCIHKWILLKLEKEDMASLIQCSDYFSKYGMDINSVSSGTLTVQSIPEVLHLLASYWTKTTSNYMNYLYNVIKAIVEEQLQSIKNTGSTTNVIPNALHKQMCKTACSSAIKFGQDLSPIDCRSFVEKLSRCNAPFLCAHGRPTAFFVGGISLNEEDPTPPNLKALKLKDI